MTKKVLIFNSQALGDCLLGTHTAKLYKKIYPDSKIYFCTRPNLVGTTAEQELEESYEVLEVLSLQDEIENVGQLIKDPQTNSFTVNFIKKENESINFDAVIEQHGWYGDLGIVKSQSSVLFETYGTEAFEDTETCFNVGEQKNLPTDHLVIATVGPLDWNRKTKNEALRLSFLTKLKYYLEQNNIKARVSLLGRDVENGSILDSLKKLNNSHIFIGPMGFHTHAAAGLGVDTISISSVFPIEYDSPEVYHSGWHKTIKSDVHCGNYDCVVPKNYTEELTPEGPRTKYGFWPKKCKLTVNGFSCVHNTSPDAILESFADWYSDKGKDLWNH